MIHAFKTDAGVLAVEADTEDEALSTLVTNGIVSPDAPVEPVACGNIVRVHGAGVLTVTDEEELLEEARGLPASASLGD